MDGFQPHVLVAYTEPSDQKRLTVVVKYLRGNGMEAVLFPLNALPTGLLDLADVVVLVTANTSKANIMRTTCKGRAVIVSSAAGGNLKLEDAAPLYTDSGLMARVERVLRNRVTAWHLFTQTPPEVGALDSALMAALA